MPKYQNKTALSLWVLVALLLFVPIAKHQHLAEHKFLSEQSDLINDSCTICHSFALQDVDNYQNELVFTRTPIITLAITHNSQFVYYNNCVYCSARAPPTIFNNNV